MIPKSYYRLPIDFFARRTHYIDHLAPVWKALEGNHRGCFYVPECIMDHARALGIQATSLKSMDPLDPIKVSPPGNGPLVIAAYGDLAMAHEIRPQRPFILMEHGVGITPSKHAGYAGGTALRRKVQLFLAPNEYIRAKTAKALPGANQVVVGTPKLDEWEPWRRTHVSSEFNFIRGKPTVAISFHFDGIKIGPEARNAFQHYRGCLAELAKQDDFTLIGHGHPRIMDALALIYQEAGIEVERDFRNIMRIADLYVVDTSSTLYEFCVTGKPVVLMNAPWYRRDVNWGIRFWDYTNIGRQVNEPEQLLSTIRWTIENSDHYALQRYAMVQDLYPFLGHSTHRAAAAILGFCHG